MVNMVVSMASIGIHETGLPWFTIEDLTQVETKSLMDFEQCFESLWCVR